MAEKYLGIEIDRKRDGLFTEQARALLMGDGFYKLPHETTPQQTLARAAVCYSFGDYDFAQRIYDYSSKHWFANASPVLSNAVEVEWPVFKKTEFCKAAEWLKHNVTPEGMPISCFLTTLFDNKKSLVETSSEVRWLSMNGGGIGVEFQNRSPDSKSTGVMAHARGYDSDTIAYKQTEKRRGSIAAYLRIDHPEIKMFMQMRNPVGGDSNKKCFNLNNAVVIPDEFMMKVIRGEDYELIDPKHGQTGKFLNAREVWEELMECRAETGEPYIMWSDTVNRGLRKWITNPDYKVTTSNLCVAPETEILTKTGHQVIADLKDQEIEVWNGEEWSNVTVRQTGVNQKLLTVKTKNGFELDCTPYHKFVVIEGVGTSKRKQVVKEAKDLLEGDKLIKTDLPVIEGSEELSYAYDNGFYSGDGCLTVQGQRIYLYGEKRKLKDFLKVPFSNWCIHEKQDREYGHTDKLKDKFFVPCSDYSIKSRVDWFAGLCDSDGTLVKQAEARSIQVASTNKEFLKGVQMMLQTLGVPSVISLMQEGGYRKLPANDGTGELKDFWCNTTYRILLSNYSVGVLQSLGFKTNRLETEERTVGRNLGRYDSILSVEDNDRKDNTFCFTEPKRNMGMFNGLLTMNCSEILEYTNIERTAVCCLSSLNLDKYHEWKDTNIVEDLVRYLDNVLEYFIQLAPKEVSKAVFSATQERSLGVGILGYHDLLQQMNIPFASGTAITLNKNIFKNLEQKGIEASKKLADERGEAPDCAGSGMRNANIFAIAPTANASSIVGASPSIEQKADNAHVAQGRAGTFIMKNKYLQKILKGLGKDTEEVWLSIVENDGSVKHLEFLDDYTKDVFATARETPLEYVVQQAADRQEHICQSQSLNIQIPAEMPAQLMSDVHFMMWEKGCKTAYYCRGKSKSKIKTGTGGDAPLNSLPVKTHIDFDECLSCQV